jgi:positive regulator of sigma E activity
MHYIGPLIVLMMGKMLKQEIFKSWDASFIMLILLIMLIQALKTKKV